MRELALVRNDPYKHNSAFLPLTCTPVETSTNSAKDYSDGKRRRDLLRFPSGAKGGLHGLPGVSRMHGSELNHNSGSGLEPSFVCPRCARCTEAMYGSVLDGGYNYWDWNEPRSWRIMCIVAAAEICIHPALCQPISLQVSMRHKCHNLCSTILRSRNEKCKIMYVRS